MKKLILEIAAVVCMVTVPAFAQVSGQCGLQSALTDTQGVLIDTPPTGDLCATGTLGNLQQSGTWTWSCLGSGGGTTAQCSAQVNPSDPCLPITMPSQSTLLDASRKVFALYFSDYFDLSYDNLPASQDFYNTSYLTPAGYWTTYGGFMRTRPLGVTPGPSTTYRMMNFAREVRMAIDRGITGFVYEVSAAQCTQYGTYGCIMTLNELMTAAANVDPRFQIVLMPDANLSASTFSSMIASVYNSPNIYKYNNKLVVAPWFGGITDANAPPVSAWINLKTQLASAGYPIYFIPIDINLYLSHYQGAADAFGLFATAHYDEYNSNTLLYNVLSPLGISVMAGVTPQHYRPSNFTYWEPRNTTGFRGGWQSAIDLNLPWVLITTWNDFSETSEIEPYTDANLPGTIGTGFYDMSGYYSAWYLTGTQPTITHDVLYYFYRKESVHDPSPNAAQPTQTEDPVNDPGYDTIEVVGFLTAPGTINITIGGATQSSSVGAGLQTFTIPLVPGTPTFSLTRNSSTVLSFAGATTIQGSGGLPNGYADMSYWSGSGSSSGMCALSVPQTSLNTGTGLDAACGLWGGADLGFSLYYNSYYNNYFCSIGTLGTVTGSGPFYWTCLGVDGGATATCSANLIVNGLVGSASGQGFISLSASSPNLCAAGQVSNFQATTNGWTWSCAGLYGGTTDNSGQANLLPGGVCGNINGMTVYPMPTSNLCTNGQASAVTAGDSWNWTCSGGGTTQSCMAFFPAYYVSPTGSDSNNGTAANTPFQTLAKAQTALQSGNSTKTVYLMNGIYNLSAPLVLGDLDSGESWLAYPEQTPILDGGANNVATGIAIAGTNGANNISVRWLTLRNFGSAGLSLWNANSDLIDSNTIDAIGTGTTGSPHPQGIAITGRTTNVMISHNEIYNTATYGIGVSSDATTNRSNHSLTLDRNYIHDVNLQSGLLETGGIYVTDPAEAETGVAISNNKIENFGQSTTTHVIGARGIYLDGGSSNINVSGNYITGRGSAAFTISGGTNITIAHNVFDISLLADLVGLYQKAGSTIPSTREAQTKSFLYGTSEDTLAGLMIMGLYQAPASTNTTGTTPSPDILTQNTVYAACGQAPVTWGLWQTEGVVLGYNPQFQVSQNTYYNMSPSASNLADASPNAVSDCRPLSAIAPNLSITGPLSH